MSSPQACCDLALQASNTRLIALCQLCLRSMAVRLMSRCSPAAVLAGMCCRASPTMRRRVSPPGLPSRARRATVSSKSLWIETTTSQLLSADHGSCPALLVGARTRLASVCLSVCVRCPIHMLQNTVRQNEQKGLTCGKLNNHAHDMFVSDK